MSFLFPDPPTQSTLADARRALYATQSSVEDITSKIDAAEAALAEIVKESRYVINEMQNERVRLEEQAFQARAYLSPIRRLPTELLRDIFMWSFEEYPCCAWVLAGVCVPWRRLALKMPKIWSKVCYHSLRYVVKTSRRVTGAHHHCATVMPPAIVGSAMASLTICFHVKQTTSAIGWLLLDCYKFCEERLYGSFGRFPIHPCLDARHSLVIYPLHRSL